MQEEEEDVEIVMQPNINAAHSQTLLAMSCVLSQTFRFFQVEDSRAWDLCLSGCHLESWSSRGIRSLCCGAVGYWDHLIWTCPNRPPHAPKRKPQKTHSDTSETLKRLLWGGSQGSLGDGVVQCRLPAARNSRNSKWSKRKQMEAYFLSGYTVLTFLVGFPTKND